MKIPEEKTKSNIVYLDPIRCKQIINDKVIKQVMKIEYLRRRLKRGTTVG